MRQENEASPPSDISLMNKSATAEPASLALLQVSMAGKVLGQADYPPGATFGPRMLSDFELVWIVQGNVVWRCGDDEHALGPSSVVLCRPKMRDAFDWDRKRRTRHGYIHFDLEDPRGV